MTAQCAAGCGDVCRSSPPGTDCRAKRARSRSKRSGERRRGLLQREADLRAAVGSVRCPDPPVVALDDLLDDRETEPRPGLGASQGRAVEAVEHVGLVLGRDARPAVADDHVGPRDRDLDGRARGAVLDRVVDEVRDRSLELRGLPEDRLDVAVESSRSPRGPIDEALAPATSVARSASTTGSGASAFELSVASSTSSATRSVSSPTSSCSASSTSARWAAGICRLRPSSSMLVRRLVSGVRSSWLASVTSRCCCGSRCRERVDHGGEAPGQAADLAVAVGRDRRREVLRARDVLGRVAQLLDGSHDAPRQPPAEGRGRGDSRQRQQERAGCASVPSTSLISSRSRRDLDDAALVPRRREHPVARCRRSPESGSRQRVTGSVGAAAAMHCVIVPSSATSCAAEAGCSSPGCGQPRFPKPGPGPGRGRPPPGPSVVVRVARLRATSDSSTLYCSCRFVVTYAPRRRTRPRAQR